MKGRERRHKRVRARVVGTSVRPRLSVYKSNRYIHAQIVDDGAGRSLFGLISQAKQGGTKTAQAHAAGLHFAEEAMKRQIQHVTFDRGGFRYSGRIRAFAEGARTGGLAF